MENNVSKPTGYDKSNPSYPAPKVLDLNAQFPNGQGVNRSPWPISNELASKVRGTKAQLHGNTNSLHSVLTTKNKAVSSTPSHL